jgi:hypothetical protein
MQETVSVYQLITRLCDNLIKESEYEVEGYTLRNARSTAFNVLLKSNCEQIPNDEKLVQELQFTSFELSLANRNKDSKHVNQFIEILRGNTSKIDSSCWFLLHLKNIDPDPEKDTLKVISHPFAPSVILAVIYSLLQFTFSRMGQISSRYHRILD